MFYQYTFQVSASLPYLALKSPRMTTLTVEEGCVSLSRTCLFFGRICLESWSIHTEESVMLLNTKWQTHEDDAVRVTGWQVCKLGIYGVP